VHDVTCSLRKLHPQSGHGCGITGRGSSLLRAIPALGGRVSAAYPQGHGIPAFLMPPGSGCLRRARNPVPQARITPARAAAGGR
jgi:hypothetical protein